MEFLVLHQKCCLQPPLQPYHRYTLHMHACSERSGTLTAPGRDGEEIATKIHHAFQCDRERLGQTRALLSLIVRLRFIKILKVTYACLYTLVYIVKNKQRPYVMSIVIAYKSFAVCLGDQWSLNLPLFTVWSLSVQWTASLFSTIVPHSLKHLSLKCLQRQINCHQEFKPGNWEWKGSRTYWIILHEMVESSFSPRKRLAGQDLGKERSQISRQMRELPLLWKISLCQGTWSLFLA